MELILPDGGSGFSVNAGVRIHGSTSRDPNWTRKHSFRFLFKRSYGGALDYALFPDSAVQRYDTLILTAGFNLSWNARYQTGGQKAQFVRDQFCSDVQLGMKGVGVHGRYVHLYLNGLYWGLYNLHERPDDNFAATYQGGDNTQYDVVRNTQSFFEVASRDANAGMR